MKSEILLQEAEIVIQKLLKETQPQTAQLLIQVFAESVLDVCVEKKLQVSPEQLHDFAKHLIKIGKEVNQSKQTSLEKLPVI